MSWISTILFLQQSLDQHDLSLCGNLANRWDGVWHIHDPAEFSLGQHGKRPQRGACLKHHVENFASKGGYLPLFETDDGRFLEAGDISDKLRRRPCKTIEKAYISRVMRCGPFVATFCSR